MLAVVARLAKKLQVAPVVGPAAGNWHDVIHMPSLPPQTAATTRAFMLL